MLFEDGFVGAFWQGLRFDLSAFAYLNIIFILMLVFPSRKRENPVYQKILKILFISFNSFALLLNLTDVVNVQFTGKRMTADILSFILQGDDATNVAGDFIKDYWSLFVVFGILIFTMYKAYSWIEKDKNTNKALVMLKRANDLKKNDGYITDSLGWALYKLENFSEAKIYLERAIKIMPDDPIVNDHFADCLWQNNKKIRIKIKHYIIKHNNALFDFLIM